MVTRSYVLLVSTCFLLIFNLLVLIACKKYGGTNIIISGGSSGCDDSWSGGCGGGKGNIILTNSDKKGKSDKIIISTGGGCCGWKSHGHHHHSWKPVVVPIKVPSYHSHWPVTNWPHTPSWSHHTLGHHNHHHHAHHPHSHIQSLHHSPSAFHDLISWDKNEPLLSPGWDNKHEGDSVLPTSLWGEGKQSHSHHLHGDHHELSVTPINSHHPHQQHSPWNEWLGSSSVSPSWLKKNDFGSLDELSEDSWNEIWR